MLKFFDFLRSLKKKGFEDVCEQVIDSLIDSEDKIIQSSGTLPHMELLQESGTFPWILEEKERERLEWVSKHSE